MKLSYLAPWFTAAVLGCAANVAFADDSALIAQGKALATAGDCQACHRTKEDAEKLPLSGGYVIESPMGAIVSSNITPSKTHGIGNYTEAQFAAALRDGVRADGANLYPAMPYTSYRGLSDDDVHALYTYFMKGVTPVDQATAQTELSFPFNQRWLMKGWNLLFLKGEPAKVTPLPTDEQRGKYLVDTLGHCGSCHTPRNVMMAESSSQYLAGGSVGGWYAPNITSDPVSGIGAWTQDELVKYLQSGHVAGKGQAGGGMAEAIEHSLRHLPEQDLHAIAAYLKDVPAIRDPKQSRQRSDFAGSVTSIGRLEPLYEKTPDAMTDSTSLDGARLYAGACASCHQSNGQGTADQFYPSLRHNSATGDVEPGNLVMAIVQGIDRTTNDNHVSMPAFKDQLSDAQIASVSNYVLKQFGNDALEVSADQVKQIREGGPAPLLVRATPWLMAIGEVAIILLIILFTLYRRKRSG